MGGKLSRLWLRAGGSAALMGITGMTPCGWETLSQQTGTPWVGNLKFFILIKMTLFGDLKWLHLMVKISV